MVFYSRELYFFQNSEFTPINDNSEHLRIGDWKKNGLQTKKPEEKMDLNDVKWKEKWTSKMLNGKKNGHQNW